MKKQTSTAVSLRLLPSSTTLVVSAMILLSCVQALKSGNAHKKIAAFSTVAGKQYHSRLSTPIQQPQCSAKLYSPPLYRFHKQMLESRYLSCPSTQLFMSSDDVDGSASPKASFNIAALKKETSRLITRSIKKVGKVSARVRYAEEQLEKLKAEIDASASEEVDDELLEKLENAPNIEDHRKEMAELQSRLRKLNWLEEHLAKSPLKGKKIEVDDELLEKLENAPNIEDHRKEMAELQSRLRKLNWLEEHLAKSPLKGKKMMTLEDLQKTEIGSQVVEYVTELEINDDENQKQKRIEADEMMKRAKKQKQQQNTNGGGNETGPRLPYRRYYTENKTEIKVGKQATDNDVLSLSPEHRSGAHWWYHASGCPGSHVVLCTDDASP
eukprot:CAMPEP_0113435280 /NCGR_PEP_ID=MMETSP0013_2-20120614/36190_1 /TAXON_ID=2843 ORGANISM="Skeletonema costatum, Strain 1716" /NCGR_SAMPLE_ID=MMETSP0013_2 /ASSEMBLY_ACC=CAM_ASM_000158 /LENGTH=382 /DNA_ID=CAMNT_0000325641 /DNA_START=31 /DNA_END=1176 /DNA_ORIENTATION=- /assembly_acc=CAM_ASM_000158